MTPEESEEATRLLTAAGSDLRALRVLVADTAQANDVIGFHAQQAVEKAMKAVLVVSGVEAPDTHDLGLLLDVLAGNAIAMPESVQESDWLTPWAVAARYGATDASLDRDLALMTGEQAVDWARTIADGAS